MAGRDITEGSSGVYALAGDGLPIARGYTDVGITSSSALWQNTDVAYDLALGGQPFIYAINDQRPYVRQTAPFKKDQFDNQTEPGEQSLTGWWIRSQSSFHHGSGIKFYDPAAGDTVTYRYADSKNVNVWDKGQVTLLRQMNQGHNVTTVAATNKRPRQQLRSIQWTTSSVTYDGVLLHDGWDLDKIKSDGSVVHFVDYNTGTAEPVYAACDDGTYAYWVTNAVAGGANKIHVYKKPLNGDATSTADETLMFTANGVVAANAVMDYVKERIVLCVNNSVYEFATTASALPSPVYTHPNSAYVYTSITSSGPAIYVAGYNGIKSSIQKFTLTSAGSMPTLTSALTAAELPASEVVYSIYYYLGLMAIGTSKGVRLALVSDQDGSLTYGPLTIESTQPCYGFAGYNHYIWCATGVAGEPGTTRIDIGAIVESLRFGWSNDVYVAEVAGHSTTGVAFIGNTDRVAFCTDKVGTEVGYVYVEDASVKATEGYLQTGRIRFNTLEAKHFERMIARGDYTYGSMILLTVDKDDAQYDHITYNSTINNVEVTTEPPSAATEFLSYKFELYRDTTDTTQGPIFKGYQIKALIATARHRIIQIPVYCYDVETDRYNAVVGYEGSALSRLRSLEQTEENGDIVTWQDFNTNESFPVVIEQIVFTRMTPPDKRFTGFGGIIQLQLRTV
jgi:hypothetical protein